MERVPDCWAGNWKGPTTARAPSGRSARLPAVLQTTDDDDADRRQRAKQYWPIRRASNKGDTYWCIVDGINRNKSIKNVLDVSKYNSPGGHGRRKDDRVIDEGEGRRARHVFPLGRYCSTWNANHSHLYYNPSRTPADTTRSTQCHLVATKVYK